MDLNMTSTGSKNSRSKDRIISNSNSSQNIYPNSLQNTIYPSEHRVISYANSVISPKNVEYLEGKKIHKDGNLYDVNFENNNFSLTNYQCNLPSSVLGTVCTSTSNKLKRNNSSLFAHQYKGRFVDLTTDGNDTCVSFVDLTTIGNKNCAEGSRSSDFDSLYSRPTKRTFNKRLINPSCTVTSEGINSPDIQDYAGLPFQNVSQNVLRNTIYSTSSREDEVGLFPKKIKFLEGNQMIYKDEIPFDAQLGNENKFLPNYQSFDMINNTLKEPRDKGYESFDFNIPESKSDRRQQSSFSARNRSCTVTSESFGNKLNNDDEDYIKLFQNSISFSKQKKEFDYPSNSIVSSPTVEYLERKIIYKNGIPFDPKSKNSSLLVCQHKGSFIDLTTDGDETCSSFVDDSVSTVTSEGINNGPGVKYDVLHANYNNFDMINNTPIEPKDTGYESFDFNIPKSKSDTRRQSNFNPFCTATSERNMNNSEVEDTYEISSVPNLVESNTVEVVDLTLLEENEKLENSFNDSFEIENTIEKKLLTTEHPVPLHFPYLVKLFENFDPNILLALSYDIEDLNIVIDRVLKYQERFGDTCKKQTENTRADNVELVINKVYNTQLNNSSEIDRSPEKNFPLKQSRGKQKVEQEWELYSKNFNVEKFCNEIPEPLKFFTDINNGSSYKMVSLEYLKMRYNKITVKTIKEELGRNNYNLTKTFMVLKNIEPNRKYVRRSMADIKYSYESFNELCFLEHEEEISLHLNLTKIQKEGGMFNCDCCYDTEVLMDDIFTCKGRKHLICKTCIRRGTEVKIGQGIKKITCFLDCQEEFSLKTMEKALKPKEYAVIERQWQVDEIKAADMQDIEECPFCDYMAIPEPASPLFTCLNPICYRTSCRKCHALDHFPLKCNEELEKEVKQRTFIENEMTAALIRTCYQCKKEYIKDDGCNRIMCSCGASQCYVCRKPVGHYLHFYVGSPKPDRCPMYATDEALHVDPVISAAISAKDSLKLNTELKHDPTKILPERKNDELYFDL